MIMNKESLKNSVKQFGNNFFFNISAILIFSIFLNIDTESIILGIGVIINIIISKTMAFSSNNSFIQKYFCKPTTETEVNAAGSIQLFGFLTGYYTINRFIKLDNMTWVSCLIFLIAASILFGRLYLESSFSFPQLVSFWFLGLFVGFLVGYISGNTAKKKKKKEIEDACKNSVPDSENETTCDKSSNDDYVCQAFKDGKVFESL